VAGLWIRWLQGGKQKHESAEYRQISDEDEDDEASAPGSPAPQLVDFVTVLASGTPGR
jgi:hypothetical protein